MAAQKFKWQGHLDDAVAKGLLGKRLYVVLTTPTAGLAAVKENLAAHLAFQKDIEQRGIMFAAGPFADDAEEFWSGEGMVIIRADSVEHAREIAAADPMHTSGAREFRVRPWLINEGSLTIKMTFSDGGREVI